MHANVTGYIYTLSINLTCYPQDSGCADLVNTHLFLSILWLGVLINYKKREKKFIFMWFPIYVLSKEKLTFMPCFNAK